MKILKSFFLVSLFPIIVFSQNTVSKTEIFATMKRASKFMVDNVSFKGGYVWSYMPDFSRRWGEMEAYNTMIWIQPPGTPSMGNLFLDAYHATKDEYYYQAALQTANALIKAQHPSGGWHYMYDFSGEKSMKSWYKTIGANGWRLEEFQHYYDNATFDDGGTIEAATLLLRLYIDKQDSTIKKALDKAIQFVLNSQYPNGGWPQRYPKTKTCSTKGMPDYTSDITFNDDVAEKNINFLLLCYNEFHDTKLLDAIYRGMDNYVQMQLPMPQPGWAMQYTPDGKPASARSYEPVCISTGTTENNLYQLMHFYSLTGDKKFLARIPETIDWLESLHFPDSLIENNRCYPSFIEPGTNKVLYIHRRGSNATNGEYYVDYNNKNTLCHYRSMRNIDIAALRKAFKEMSDANHDLIKSTSILKTKVDFPRYFSKRKGKISDLNSRNLPYLETSTENVQMLISELNKEGYWPTTLTATTNPYISKAPKEITPGDYRETSVGDIYDTSPYANKNSNIKGISTGVFIKNINLLIEYLNQDTITDNKSTHNPINKSTSMKLEHFALNVEKPVEMAQWYVKYLGMKIVRKQDAAPFTHFLADESGRIMIEVYCNPANEVPPYRSMNALQVHLAFVSANPDKDKERLLTAGATFDNEVRLDDGTLLIMMRDPWGVAIQLCKRANPMLLEKEL